MNFEKIWELIGSAEVGGEKGKVEVKKVLNKVWLEEAGSRTENAKRVGSILSALDNAQYSAFTEEDMYFIKYGLVRAGFEELVRLMQ